jgi:hypothetical protein
MAKTGKILINMQYLKNLQNLQYLKNLQDLQDSNFFIVILKLNTTIMILCMTRTHYYSFKKSVQKHIL